MVNAEVDMSNQINSWNKKTALAIVQENLKYSVVMETRHKSTLKAHVDWISEEHYRTNDNSTKRKKKRFKNRTISLTHAYLLHKLIIANKDALMKVRVCRDTPARYLDRYMQCITNSKNSNKFIQKISIKFGNLRKNNTAQKYAKCIAKGDEKPSYTLTKKDIEEIIELIDKFVPKD